MGNNPRVGEVVKFGDKGISVEEARRKMLEAGQAPKGIQRETRKNESALRGTGGNTPVVQPTIPAPVVVVEKDPFKYVAAVIK